MAEEKAKKVDHAKKVLPKAKRSGENVKVRMLKSVGRYKTRMVVTLDKVEADRVVAAGFAEVWVDNELNLNNAVKFVADHGGEISVADPTGKGAALVAAMSEAGVEAGSLEQDLAEANEKIEELEAELEKAAKAGGKKSNGNKSA